MKKICVMLPFKLNGDKVNGGVPKVFINTIDGLISSGHDVYAYVHEESLSIIKELNCRPKVKVLMSKFETPTLAQDFGGLSFFKFVAMIFGVLISICKVRWQTRKIKLDVLLIHDIVGSIYSYGFNSKEKITYLHSYRSFESQKSRFLLLLITKFFSKKYISPTYDIAKEMKEINKNIDVSIINTPVISDSNLNKVIRTNNKTFNKSGPFKLVYVGRISPVKNIKDMVRFVALLNVKGFHVELDLYGEPVDDQQEKYYSEIKQLVIQLSLENNVKFRGFTSNPMSAMYGYDFSLIFSDGEAIPLSGLESLYVGTPVVGYNVPGIRDLIGDDNDRGILFERDDIESFCNNLSSYQPVYSFSGYVSKFTIESWVIEFQNKFLKSN